MLVRGRPTEIVKRVSTLTLRLLLSKKKKLENKSIRKKLEDDLNSGEPFDNSPHCRLDPHQDAQFCITHYQRADLCWPLQPEQYTAGIITQNIYTAPTRSPTSITEPPYSPNEIVYITVDDDDDDFQTPAKKKKKWWRLKGTQNEHIAIKNREQDGKNISHKILYCNEEIIEFQLEIKMNNAQPR